MNQRHPIIIKSAFFVGTWCVLLGFGEVAIRIASSRKLIYTIEMVKYAKELKEPAPEPDVSHVHKKNAKAKLMGVEVALNSFGHRSPELSPTKSPNRKRLMVLGSSVTMGWGVNYDDVFTTLVEKNLNENKPFGPETSFEFTNAGVGNYNAYYQNRLIHRQYQQVKPDAVVMSYFINDAERNATTNNPLIRYSFLAAYLNSELSGVIFQFGKHGDLFSHYNELYKSENPNWQNTLGYIHDIRDTLANDNVPFLIMILPDIHNLGNRSPYQPLYQKMEAAFNGLGIPTLNTFESFRTAFGGNERSLWIQPDDPHPNAAGHKLMADLLYNYIVEKDPFELARVRSQDYGTVE